MMQHSNETTYNISSNIIRAFEKVIERDNKESLLSLMHFVRNVLQSSFQNNSLKHFEQYIFFPAAFYNISFEKAQKNALLNDIFKDCVSLSSRNLKEILWIDLSIFGKKSTELEDKKLRNPYYYFAFSGFSRLFFFMVKNRDINSFRFAMKEFEQVSDGTYSGNFNLKFQIADLKRENNEIDKERITKLKSELQIQDQFNIYYRHVLIGIKYWIIFLYSENEIKQETVSSLIDEIRIPSTDSETLLRDIFLFRNNSLVQRYMGWDDWDHVERHSGITYSPPMVNNWTTLGFIVDQIRENRIYINLNEIDNEEISQAIYLYEDLKLYTSYLQENFQHWKTILKVETAEDLKNKCDNLLSIYAVVKRKSTGQKERSIANAPLDQEKVNEFKEQVGKAWKSNAAIHKLFRAFGNVEHISEGEIKLKSAGKRTFFEKAKTMFIDGEHYQPIVGIDRMGGEIGRTEDNSFFALLFKEEYSKETGINAVEVLEKAIKSLTLKKIKADIIILSPEFTYRDKEFINDERFISKDDANNTPENFGKFHIGYFDKVPLYSSHSDFLKNTILVCDFKSAFKMRYKTNPDWFEEELNVDVREITDDEAQRKLEANPQKWKGTEEGIILGDQDALIMIKTSVIIDIWTVIDFQVLNKDAYIIGNIEPRK